MSNLVFQTAFLGDLLLSIPLLKNLKKLFPHQPLVLICRKGFGAFFLEHNLVDEVYEMDKKDPASIEAVMTELKQRQWNYIVSPHESFRTASLLRSLKAKKKVAFRRWFTGFFYDETLAKPYHLPDALRQMSLLTLLSEEFKNQFDGYIQLNNIKNPIEQTQYEWSFGELPDWASLKVVGPAVINPNLMVLAPGSVWNTKRWTLEGYEQLAIHFIKNNFQVVLIGTKQEEGICQQIADKVPQVINKAGQTSLSELFGILKNAGVLFCNDSGAMHLAAAAGTPTVSVFGPTVLSQGFMPWNQNSIVVQQPLSCRPCGRHGSQKCPIGTHECMKGIGVKEVLSSYELLQKSL